jgi:MarR family transcriptional regulator for hemolysin
MGADLMFLLSQASHALTTELTAGLAGVGISPRSHCVLRAALAGERTQTQIAEQCALDKTTMVVTVDQLEAAGLAERRPSRTDRRARIIAVTPAGEAAVAAADAIVEGVYRDVLAAMPPAESAGFVAALERLAGAGGRLATPVACDRPVRRRMPRVPEVTG